MTALLVLLALVSALSLAYAIVGLLGRRWLDDGVCCHRVPERWE
jgi:hypothetical protein